MNGLMKNLAGLIILLVLSAGSLLAMPDSTLSSVSVRAYVELENTPLNGEVAYHVEIAWQGDLSEYQFDDINDPVVSNLKLRGSGSGNKVTMVKGKPQAVRSVIYYYTPQEIGMAYVDGATLTYENSKTHRQEYLITKRVSIKIGDPIAKKNKGFLPGSIVLWALLIGFVLAIIYALIRFFQQRNKVKELNEQKPLSLEEKYLSLLNDDIHPGNNKNEENLASIYKLLASYISERFAIPGTISNDILIDRLNALNQPAELIARIENLAGKADQIRFAGEKADPADIHLLYDSVELILKNNMQKLETGEEEKP